MTFPRFLRSPLARLIRSLPIKGRWRIAAHLNRLFPAEQTTFELSGVGRVTLDLGIEMQQHVYWAGLSRDDGRILRLARAVLPPDGVFLDVGANVGLHTLAVARHLAGGGGAVVAFEPHPVNHRLLVHNIRQNRLRHVVAENLGLAEAPATLIGNAAADGGNWSLASRGDYRFEVRLTPLDDYLRANPMPRLDLMKIDVEGAEVRVLRGARKTIERFRPLIVFEVCPAWLAKMQTSAAELFTELVGHGYSIHALPGRKLVWDRRVKVGDLVGLEPGAFVNLVAVPPASARAHAASPLHANIRG
ncbi:MAG TPA: FkbM family methyltransferase [Gemmataceae bacterium]|jgi:FkbM family methyltransferase